MPPPVDDALLDTLAAIKGLGKSAAASRGPCGQMHIWISKPPPAGAVTTAEIAADRVERVRRLYGIPRPRPGSRRDG